MFTKREELNFKVFGIVKEVKELLKETEEKCETWEVRLHEADMEATYFYDI